jgi:hypothetical protein
MIEATATNNHEEGETMKNPLDSLGQTVTLGFVLTLIAIGLIHIIA